VASARVVDGTGQRLIESLGFRVGGYRQVRHLHRLKKEALITSRVEPDSGTLLTCVQFLFVASTGYVSQFDSNRPPFFLKPNRVPIRRWLINILLFFTINVLNNHAFSYNISVPIHIILRSGGSITTLIAGFIWGKRFSRIQILAVTLLTIGVIIAAWSDQQSKVCMP
jgi:UDP-xylose/UDP-N-acetylglucosamine transporter B4